MSKKSNPKLIGSFVLGAAVLVVAGVVAFGGGQWFTPLDKHVSFFRGSVQGLRVGAPVTFRGVPIGQVTDIDLLYEVKKLEFMTQVLFDVDPDSFRDIGKTSRSDTDQIEELIKNGLRVQLVQQSFVTGQLAVTMDMFPGTEVTLLGLDPHRLEVPSIPSTIEKLEETIKNIAKKLENISIEEITDDLQQTMTAIRELATRPELHEAVVNANNALKEAEGLFASLNARVDPLATSLLDTSQAAQDTLGEAERLLVDARPAISDARKTLANAQGALARAETLMSTANAVIEPGSPLHFELSTMIREVAGAARSLRSLADTLERNPNSLPFGRQKPGGR